MISPTITAPEREYTRHSEFAVVNDIFHIFGGTQDSRKIAKLEGCGFVELPARLNFPLVEGGGSLAVNGGSEALLCWESDGEYYDGSWPGTSCDVFDGTNSNPTFSATYKHYCGGLAYYQGQPTTVGGCDNAARNKVSTLTTSGWVTLTNANHPTGIWSHSIVGLDSGSLLLVGGYNGDYVDEIWLLQNNGGIDSWSQVGNLQKAVTWTSAIRVGESIYVIPGAGDAENPQQRIDMVGDQVSSCELLGDLGSFFSITSRHGQFSYPVAFVVPSLDFCTN